MGARAGYHHSPGAIFGDTASGAATGATIGSFAGPEGTAIGGGIGAIGGFLTGLLTGDQPDLEPPPSAPPPPEDLADAIARRAKLAQQSRLMASGAGTFLSGPLGDTSATPGTAPKAGGY